MVFYFNRGSLEIGHDWQDKSIILLTNEFGQSISISYDKLPFGMSFSEFCEREITSLGKQLTDYKEVSREIDHKVYELYGLTDDEINFVETMH